MNLSLQAGENQVPVQGSLVCRRRESFKIAIEKKVHQPAGRDEQTEFLYHVAIYRLPICEKKRFLEMSIGNDLAGCR